MIQHVIWLPMDKNLIIAILAESPSFRNYAADFLAEKMSPVFVRPEI